MIVDELVNWRRYFQNLRGLENVFKFLEEKTCTRISLGTKMPLIVDGKEIDDRDAFS